MQKFVRLELHGIHQLKWGHRQNAEEVLYAFIHNTYDWDEAACLNLLIRKEWE